VVWRRLSTGKSRVIFHSGTREHSFTESTQLAVTEIVGLLGLNDVIRNVDISKARSPWDEKTRLRLRKGCFDTRLHLWDSFRFLYARIYRLLLYVSDSLDLRFHYDPNAFDDPAEEPRIRETHNHIWGIYVDSRVERKGLDNFFDRTLRRNLFIDSQRSYPWSISKLFFEKLWERERFTHAEIIEYARNPDRLLEDNSIWDRNAFEIEISRSLGDHSVKKHIDDIPSPILRDFADDILRFVASHCRGTLIESSYYGTYFMYDQEIFAEMLTTKSDSLLLTLFDFQRTSSTSYVVGENSKDIPEIEGAIKTIYDSISLHSQLKAMKNPYGPPIQK
jgi:hypothetical protein